MAIATIPVVGLYFPLVKASFISALLWTVVLQMVVPVALAQTVTLFATVGGPMASSDDFTLMEVLLRAGFQRALACLLGWCLHANLKKRKFASSGRTA